MTESPIIITRSREQRRSGDEFPFTSEMIPYTSSEFFSKYQKEAWNTFSELPYPTDKDEPWRRTTLNPLGKKNLVINWDAITAIVPEEYSRPLLEGSHSGQLILYPGGKSSFLMDDYSKQGVIYDDLENVLQTNPELIEKTVGTIVHANDGKFSAMASALAIHGVFLYVPRGVKITEPIHSLVWNDGNNSAAFSHHVVWLEEGAEATFVQEYASAKNQLFTQFHSGILEVFVGAGASLRMVELQSWGEGIWNIMHERVSVQKDGNLSWIFGALGSKLTKSFSSVELVGAGATAKISGFYFADADQHFDMDTEQMHRAPNTTSDLLYKGAVTGNARSVWQGNIYVASGANGTDGYQANRNLILSRQARADSIPGLEILADDVKCTHGATVGKVDPDQVFYLRSRGLTENEAQHLIVEGFFEPIMDRIPFIEVQERFRQAIIEKIDTQA